jgi:hypothetical protein
MVLMAVGASEAIGCVGSEPQVAAASDAGGDSSTASDAAEEASSDATTALDGDANVASDGGGPVDASNDGSSNDAGTDANCGSNPTLHPSTGGPGALFCPFFTDGGFGHCTPKTQVCCVGGKQGAAFVDSVCNAAGMQCTNGVGPKEFDCTDQNDCGSGEVCCMTGPGPTLDACGYYKATGTTGSKCELGTTCQGGELRVCESNTQCMSGQMCTPFKASIYFQFGFCI